MKYNIKKYASRLFTAAIIAASLTSCDDFLTIKPLNDVVLDNFWTEEADVNSVVRSCYSQLQSEACVKRMIVWGELRSDNLETKNSYGELGEINKENILETNSYADWACFYNCINRCNTVIHYAPEVAKIDPNYTEAELRATIAEVTAIRSLCYFYLIRTFRDVPLVLEPTIDDTKDFKVPPSSFDVVLNHLISDLESVKDDAIRSYGNDFDSNGDDTAENHVRITRYAIYAMLADMYLWKGDYQQCVDYCEKIIQYKKDQYEDMLKELTSMDYELYGVGKVPLISIAPGSTTTGSRAYNRIFGDDQQSFESIFELEYNTSDNVNSRAITDFYGGGGRVAELGCPSYITAEAATAGNEYFNKTDMRLRENLLENSSSSKSITILKYYADDVQYRTTQASGQINVSTSTRSSEDANWIIYRLTDVLLMKAEALVMMAPELSTTPDDEEVTPEEGTETTETTEGEGETNVTSQRERYFRNAFAQVMTVWKRGNNKRTSVVDTLQYSHYSGSKRDMENLVMGERQRELMFEGKRWYDLVRMCRRDGDNTRMVQKVIPKFEENVAAVRIRLMVPDALFWPYNRQELKVNPYLVQNPAYKDNENYEKQ